MWDCVPWRSRTRTTVAEPAPSIQIGASSVDIDRLFEEAGRAFSHGLQMEYWRAHAGRDAVDVKVGRSCWLATPPRWASWRSLPPRHSDVLYDQRKSILQSQRNIGAPPTKLLRLATATPNEVPQHLPDSIDFVASQRIRSGIATCLSKAMGSSGPSWAPGRRERAQRACDESVVVGCGRPQAVVAGDPLRHRRRTGHALDLVVIRKKGPSFEVDILEPATRAFRTTSKAVFV